MNKVLIDTNILIYSIDEDSKYFKRSQELIFNDANDLYTTSKNLIEFLTVITRLPHSSSLSIQQALDVINDFRNIFTILFPTKQSFKILNDLLTKYKPSGLKIHDFEIISIAIAHQVFDIATMNIKDFKEVSEINIFEN